MTLWSLPRRTTRWCVRRGWAVATGGGRGGPWEGVNLAKNYGIQRVARPGDPGRVALSLTPDARREVLSRPNEPEHYGATHGRREHPDVYRREL